MTTTELARASNGAVQYRPTSIGTERLGEILVRSGFFKDTRDQAQAIVKVLAGAELGLGPIASMTGIYIVEGKISLSAGLIAAAIQRSGKYRYRVTEWGDAACSIDFYEGQEKLGPFRFTMDDAKLAGLAGKGPWRQYPRAMLWARAMSGGARAYCPEIFSGAIYTPEELGEEVNEEGEPINVTPREIRTAPPEPAPQVTHEQPGPPTREQLEERWAGLWRRAKELGCQPSKAITKQMSDVQVTAWCDQLAARIREMEERAEEQLDVMDEQDAQPF